MMPDTLPERPAPAETSPSLAPAARRALDEAAERRAAEAQGGHQPPAELNGRGGMNPVRYGDWEVKGIASDF